MESILLEGDMKKQYLDDLVGAMEKLSGLKAMPDKLPQITRLMRSLHFLNSVDVHTKSGFVRKDEIKRFRQETPFIDENDEEIENRGIKGRILDLFEFPAAENLWMRYIISFQRMPRKPDALLNLDYSHLRDAEYARTYLENSLTLKPNRIEKCVLGPFLAEYIPYDGYGVVSSLVKSSKGSWLLVYRTENMIKPYNEECGTGCIDSLKDIFRKPIMSAFSSQTYLICTDDLKERLETLYAGKNIISCPKDSKSNTQDS